MASAGARAYNEVRRQSPQRGSSGKSGGKAPEADCILVLEDEFLPRDAMHARY